MIVWLNACPMCSTPVTLGGGSWMQNAGLPGSAPAANQPASSQRRYQRRSTAPGSKPLSRDIDLLRVGILRRRAERLRDRNGDRLAHHPVHARRELGAHAVEHLLEHVAQGAGQALLEHAVELG